MTELIDSLVNIGNEISSKIEEENRLLEELREVDFSDELEKVSDYIIASGMFRNIEDPIKFLRLRIFPMHDNTNYYREYGRYRAFFASFFSYMRLFDTETQYTKIIYHPISKTLEFDTHEIGSERCVHHEVVNIKHIFNSS